MRPISCTITSTTPWDLDMQFICYIVDIKQTAKSTEYWASHSLLSCSMLIPWFRHKLPHTKNISTAPFQSCCHINFIRESQPLERSLKVTWPHALTLPPCPGSNDVLLVQWRCRHGAKEPRQVPSSQWGGLTLFSVKCGLGSSPCWTEPTRGEGAAPRSRPAGT